MKNRLKAVSLFASGGIGDLGLRAAGIETICANELLPERAALFEANFPDCAMIAGDIGAHIDEVVYTSKNRLKGDELFLLLATPPCQGMSSNGTGKLLSEIRKGKRPKLDPRNELILPTIRIISELKPRWVIFENVVGMENTVIEFGGGLARILDVVEMNLSPEYRGKAYRVQMADYGIPQRRTRLITVYTRDAAGTAVNNKKNALIPKPTYSKSNWISVNDAIGHFSPLDSKSKETAKSRENALHRVPVLDSVKYFWISNTPLNESAFNNQCVNPACGCQANPRHGAERSNGINQSKKDTPIYCIECGSLLPRPVVRDEKGQLRLMKGYISAYKRMSGNLPAPTITTNFAFPCSDHKIHPTQNRVLSLAEAEVLQTISRYNYKWEISKNGITERASASLIREVIGESVPPYFTEQLCKHVIDLGREGERQLKLIGLTAT